jgi:hypothetical protein
MATVRITSTRGVEHVFDLPPEWAFTVEVDGREYVGVIMADDEHPVQVVYWPDEQGEDNVTVSPPGVPVPEASTAPADERRVTLADFGSTIDALDREGDPEHAVTLGHAYKIPGHGWNVRAGERIHHAAGLTKKDARTLLRTWAQQALNPDAETTGPDSP